MQARVMMLLIFTAFFLVIDYYLYQAVVQVTSSLSPGWKNTWRLLFWLPALLSIIALVWWTFGDPYQWGPQMRNWIITGIVGVYLSKIVGVLVLFAGDLFRGVKWLISQVSPAKESIPGEAITRSEFLSKSALIASAIPFGTMAFGILSGAHDYRIRRTTVHLPNLPKSFDGLTIGQLSDIHSGSFFNKTAVMGGVEMMMKEKPDLILFTGDLVNNVSSEVADYVPVFGKLKAPLGVFSVTGNHDYGDYHSWATRESKLKNFANLVKAHDLMNFDILMNEHRMIEQGGEKIAIIGNENWGAGRFSKYGKLDQAWKGTEGAAVKLLLSHDPSHWDAQVRPSYPDIDIMFAGHTHGFQFGVEIGDFKWSPSQYVYKQWAGLYQQGHQYLYVNRGFGYLGYPGRIGMPPELTIMTLKRA